MSAGTRTFTGPTRVLLWPIMPVLLVAIAVWGLTAFDLSKRRPDQIQGLYLADEPAGTWTGVPRPASAQYLSATDPLTSNGPWYLERRGAAVDLGAGVRAGAGYRTDHLGSVRVGEGRQSFDVDSWGGSGAPALFAIEQRRAGPFVTVHGLGPSGGVLAQGGPALAQVRGGARTALIAKWTGTEPDLFVIDARRSASQRFRPWEMRIYSGESGFRRQLESVTLPARVGSTLTGWWIDLGRISGQRPDLVLTSRNRTTATGRTEIHVVTGDSNFQAFSTEGATPLPERPGAGDHFIYVGQGKAGALMNVDAGERSLTLGRIPLQ
jgi:hypothetical protein